MKILFDECLPKKLKYELINQEIKTVPEMGWAGKTNGELISLAQPQFDAFITVDKKLTHQQNLQDIGFAIIVLAAKRNTFDSLKPLFAEVENALNSIKSGEVLLIKPIE